MKTVFQTIRPLVVALLAVAGVFSTSRAQEISITDAGLDAAIRAELNKPTGIISATDILTLTNLDASRRNIQNIGSFASASNLVTLNLQINLLSNVSIPSGLNKLAVIDLSSNPLT